MKPLLQNLCLSLGDNEELCYCLAAWGELSSSVRNGGRVSKEEALLAVAVLNRIRRAISTVSTMPQVFLCTEPWIQKSPVFFLFKFDHSSFLFLTED